MVSIGIGSGGGVGPSGIDLRRGVGRISMESITRPSAGERVLKQALAKVPAEDNSGDADFRWGKPSRFTLTEPVQRNNPGVTYNFPPDDPQDDPQNPIVIHDYDYIDRSVEVIRVEQEGEPENWVEVERILKVMFVNRETGEYVRFNFDWSKKPSSTSHA